jgi:hypothetical protein
MPDRLAAQFETHAGDVALVALAQCDRQAFAMLYERHHRPVYLYYYRRLLNAEAAGPLARPGEAGSRFFSDCICRPAVKFGELCDVRPSCLLSATLAT